MFIPYNTDAPIYHWPLATVGLIVANAWVFFLLITGGIDDPEALILTYGEGLQPLQWVTSNFLHGSPMHLIGNMFFLWGFGLVVEGKIGWWRFLLIYLGIGILECAGEQMLMNSLGKEGGSLGASSILFALMAISWVWAPKNEMDCVLIIFHSIRHVSVSILMFGTCYILLELAFAALTGFRVSSATLHLAGAAPGFLIGFAMLKLDWVDCEGWDVLTLWRGESKAVLLRDLPDSGPTRADEAIRRSAGTTEPSRRTPDLAGPPDAAERRTPLADGELDEGHRKMRQVLHRGEIDLALQLHQEMNRITQQWQLEFGEITEILRLLHAGKRWGDSIPFMEEFLERFPDSSGQVRVKLAQVYIVDQERPKKGLALLQPMRSGGLDEAVVDLRRRLIIRARKMIEEGTLELQ